MKYISQELQTNNITGRISD